MIKYTKEQLMKMPMHIVRGLDIRNTEEEKLIQEVVNERAVVSTPIIKFGEIIPDIKNGEQEKVWQKKIDDFNKKNSPVEATILEAEKELEKVNKELTEVSKPVESFPQVVEVKNGEIIKPFCDKCTSKGVRHKKECPLYVPTIKTNAENNTDSDTEAV